MVCFTLIERDILNNVTIVEQSTNYGTVFAELEKLRKRYLSYGGYHETYQAGSSREAPTFIIQWMSRFTVQLGRNESARTATVELQIVRRIVNG